MTVKFVKFLEAVFVHEGSATTATITVPYFSGSIDAKMSAKTHARSLLDPTMDWVLTSSKEKSLP